MARILFLPYLALEKLNTALYLGDAENVYCASHILQEVDGVYLSKNEGEMLNTHFQVLQGPDEKGEAKGGSRKVMRISRVRKAQCGDPQRDIADEARGRFLSTETQPLLL